MFISQPQIKAQSKDAQNIRSTKISENIRTSQISQKIRLSRLSSNHIRSSQNASPSKINPLQTVYVQLHKYIETIDQRISNLLQKQSNEYKVVYQHYYKKFKDELQELKEKTLQQQKKFLKNDHVKYMQSQLKILRQEVVAYKNSYEKLKKENQQLKDIIDIYKNDVNFLQNNVKNRIKEIKLLTVQNSKLEGQIKRESSNQTKLSKANISNKKEFKKRSHSMDIESLSQPQIKVEFHKYRPNPVYKQMASNRNLYQEYFFTDQSTKENKTASFRSLIDKSNDSIKGKIKYVNNTPVSKDKKYFRTEISQKAQKSSKIFNICEWFLDCVETVKKQIFHRKSLNTSFQLDSINNGFRYLDSLDDFKKLDKLEVLKVFLSSEQILSTMYHLLKNQKKIQLQNYVENMPLENNLNSLKKQENQNFQARFSNLELRRTTKRPTHTKTMTQIGFFDWNLVEKAHKFQHLSQFSTTAAINRTNLHSSKSNQKRNNKSPDQKGVFQLQINPRKVQQQKNIKMMKKITVIINKKKNVPLSSQLFARKKNFIIE